MINAKDAKMSTSTRDPRPLLMRLAASAVFVLLLVLGMNAAASAQGSGTNWYQTQAIEAADLGISNPVGLAFAAETDTLFALSAPTDGTAVREDMVCPQL